MNIEPATISAIESKLTGVTDIPTLPVVVTRVLQIIDRPETTFKDLSTLVSADQVIASRIIKVVNSPLYAVRQEVKNLQQAMTYLGMTKIKNLILTCSLISHFSKRESAFNLKVFWEHSFGCGIVCRQIATKIGAERIEEIYLAGLIHDIGEVVLSTLYHNDFRTIYQLAEDTGISFHEAEKAILGYTHCEVGAWLGMRWHFPEELLETICCHHAVHTATAWPTTVAIVNLADLFCRVRSLGYGYFERLDVSFADEPAWDILRRQYKGLDNIDLARFTYEMDEQMEEVLKLIESVY